MAGAPHRLTTRKPVRDAGKAPQRLPGAGSGAARRILLALLVAGVLMLAFNSTSLNQATGGLRIGPVENALMRVAENWHGLMRSAGLDILAERVRDAVLEGEQAGWPDIGGLTRQFVGPCSGDSDLRGSYDAMRDIALDENGAGHDFAAESSLNLNPACYLPRAVIRGLTGRG